MISRYDSARRLLRDALLPPWFEEPRTDGELRWFARVRLLLIATALMVDASLFVMLRGVDGINQVAIEWFAVINGSLLVADAAITWLLLRRNHRFAPVVETIAIAMEMFTIAVWIQLTGTVSSYFIATAFVLPFGYRLATNYRVGALAYACMLGFHAGAFALEELGVLDHVALFATTDNPMYDVPRYRHLVMASLVSSYVAAFGVTNHFVIRRRRRESELREAREQLADLAAGMRYGRLSGTAIAAGDYEVGEVLGRGGMGEVYRARRADGVECAIKVIHPHLARQERSLARFRQEAVAAAKLPNAVAPRLLDARLDSADRFIAMEYLRGEDLAAHLRRHGRVPAREALRLLRAIAERIDAAHAVGLVHRDLKPHNVFLVAATAGEPPAVRLLDFGIAKLRESTSDLTRTGAILGSPGYMAPEQLGAAAATGPAADTFALGAIAYELLTGTRAFPVAGEANALEQLLYTAPVAPSAIDTALPAAVDAVLAIAMAKNPADRFASGGALVDALAAAVAGELPKELRARAGALGALPLTPSASGDPDDATVATVTAGDD